MWLSPLHRGWCCVAVKPPRALRILIADDHGLFRAGLIHLIGELAEQVSVLEANSLEEAIAQIDPMATPDMMLVDLIMPGMDAQGAGIRRLRKLAPDMPLVVLSAKNQASDVREAIEAGALGFIPKSSSPEIMLNALRLVLSGGVYLPAEVMGGSASPARPEPVAAPSALTPRQRQILTLLAEGCTNKDMARRLGLSAGTVKVHVSQILRALGVANRTQAAAAALSWMRSHPGQGG
jgi:DNA-binding NarL/FixJ family response regulator